MLCLTLKHPAVAQYELLPADEISEISEIVASSVLPEVNLCQHMSTSLVWRVQVYHICGCNCSGKACIANRGLLVIDAKRWKELQITQSIETWHLCCTTLRQTLKLFSKQSGDPFRRLKTFQPPARLSVSTQDEEICRLKTYSLEKWHAWCSVAVVSCTVLLMMLMESLEVPTTLAPGHER